MIEKFHGKYRTGLGAEYFSEATNTKLQPFRYALKLGLIESKNIRGPKNGMYHVANKDIDWPKVRARAATLSLDWALHPLNIGNVAFGGIINSSYFTKKSGNRSQIFTSCLY